MADKKTTSRSPTRRRAQTGGRRNIPDRRPSPRPPTPTPLSLHVALKTDYRQEWADRVAAMGLRETRREFLDVVRTFLPTDMQHTAFTAHPNSNRYRDVFCLDSTRVKLLGRPPNDDYVHASMVNEPYFGRKIICAQGPLKETVADFWLMCAQQKTEVIVMLCKLVENNKEKCYQYWPDQVGTSRTYGDVDVSLNSSKVIKGVEGGVERSLTVRHDGKQMTVKHLQWQNWRDHGFPDSAEETMTLLRTARTYQKKKSQAMVVHCSAGIGRTGALVAIELALSKANANRRPLDMPRLVKLLRGQRVHSIQNDGQYAFVHFVVLTWLVSPRHPAPFVTRTAAIDQWLHDFRDLIARRRQDL